MKITAVTFNNIDGIVFIDYLDDSANFCTRCHVCQYVSARLGCGDHGWEGLSRTKPRTAGKKKFESTPPATRGTHGTHTRGTRNTAVRGSEIIFTEIENDAPKKGLEVSTTLGCPRNSQCEQQCCCTCGSMPVSHIRNPQLYRSQSPIKKQLLIGSHSNTAVRTNYPTRIMLLPVLLAVVGRAVYCFCSCAVCCLWCLGYVRITKKRLEKKIKMHDACEDRLELSPLQVKNRASWPSYNITGDHSKYYCRAKYCW